MKLITTLAKLSMLLILIGQICMINSKSQSATLENRVEKTKADPKPADLVAAIKVADNPALIKAIADKAVQISYDEDLSKSVLLDGSKDSRFLILGDTGQVDTYFKEYLERSIGTKVGDLEELSDGKFETFEKILEANKAAPKYDQGIILGDFIYTENKGSDIELDDVVKLKLDLATLKDNREMTHKPSGKKVLTLFKNRLTKSATKLNELLTKSSAVVPFWLLLSGNHSYDIDSAVEKVAMNTDKTKVRMYKNSKVHVSKDACFADLSFGDLVCLNKTYTECLGTALGNSRYGKDEKETSASLVKTIEAILTLKLCKDKWRIIRTHAAPFNSEIDQHYLFNKFKGDISCKVRKAIPGLEISDKDNEKLSYSDLITKIEASKVNLTYEMLRDNSQGIRTKAGKDPIKAVENRLFRCEITGTSELHSVMEIVESAAPHFYLGSHLHASQLLFAPAKMNSYNFNKFKQSEAIMGKTGCNEINYINKVVEDKLEDKLEAKGLPNEPDAYKIESCDEKSLVREAALKIKKDKPDYNIIFVIGNSGRFLDTFVDGTQSASHIIWQRINTSEKGTAFELMKKEAKIFKDTGKSSGTTTVQQILDAEKATAYGFAELVIASNNSASVEYKELDPKDQKIKTVLKINLTLGTETKPSYNKNFGYLKNSKDTPATTKTAKRKLRKLK